MNRREALQALVALPAVKSIAVANVRPSDVIVVECEELVSSKEMENIRLKMSEIWPGRKVAIFSGGVRMRIAREAE